MHVRVLIVCEGSKTERNYFSDLATHYRLSDGTVTVVGLGETSERVVEEAKRRRYHESRAGDSYDKVFYVFDRDEHTGFERASIMARKSGFELARSWPCFEFWFLLHFRYTRMPFARSGSNSPADACLHELKRYWPEYAKNLEGLFQSLRNSLDDAKRHAIRVAREAEQEDEPNPSTEVHKLVDYLRLLVSTK